MEDASITGLSRKSGFWVQRKATITGCRCRITQIAEARALGAALLAGMGSGAIDGLESAMRLVTHGMRETDPEPGLHRLFEEKYRMYWRIEEAFAGVRPV